MARDADRTRGSSSSPSKYINHPSAPPQQVPSSTCPFITSVILPRRLLLLSVLLALDSSSSLGRAHGHSGSPPPSILSFADPETPTSETHFIKCSCRLVPENLKMVHQVYRQVVHDEVSAKRTSIALILCSIPNPYTQLDPQRDLLLRPQ